jgi:hypothetical protein
MAVRVALLVVEITIIETLVVSLVIVTENECLLFTKCCCNNLKIITSFNIVNL